MASATDTIAAPRRMGPKGSDVWHAMLDAAEDVLREEGYGALTSRRVAERTGVKQRLIYYYFTTMDELIVETFRRMKARELEHLSAATGARHGLREIWAICTHSTDTRIVQEFMALANRIDTLRAEVVDFIETSRAMQIEALAAAMEASGLGKSLSPAALAIFATSAALALQREAGIGISTGHDEVLGVIEGFLARLDPPG